MALKPFFQAHLQEQERKLAAQHMTRQQQFENGFLGVKDLDDEELRAGKCRDESGSIPRRKGKTDPIPADMYDEMVAEHERRFTHRLRENLDTMIDVMVTVATDDTVEPRDRLEAAKYVFERVAGKTPERIQVAVAKAPWEEVLHGIAQVTRDQSRAIRAGDPNVIDADVVDPNVVDQDTYRPPPTDTDTMYQTEGDIGKHQEAHSVPASGDHGQEPNQSAERDIQRDTAPYGARVTASYAAPTCPPITHEYKPAEKAPSWDEPASSSSTMRVDPAAANAQPRVPTPDQAAAMAPVKPEPSIQEAYAAAQDLAERRKAARKRIKDAKARRIKMRTVGVDGFKKAAEGGTPTFTEVPSADESGEVQIQFGLAPPEATF